MGVVRKGDTSKPVKNNGMTVFGGGGMQFQSRGYNVQIPDLTDQHYLNERLNHPRYYGGLTPDEYENQYDGRYVT